MNSTEGNPDPANAPEIPWETPGTMNHGRGYHRLHFRWKSIDSPLDTPITNTHQCGAIANNVGSMFHR